MAMKPLGERLDELSSVEKDVAEIQAQQPNEPLPEPIEYTQAEPSFEPVDVAGLPLGVLKGVIKKAPKREIKPPEGAVGPYQTIPNAPVEVVEKVEREMANIPPEVPMEGKPPETAFNLDMIQDDNGLKQFIDVTARVYGADKLEKVSYKEIAAKASEEGYDEAFLARIIDPTKITEANASQAYKMLLAITDAGKRAFDLGEKVKQAKLDGTLNSDLAVQFQQALAVEGALLKAAKGRQADIARTLGVFSQARTSTAERGAMLDAILTESGGIDTPFALDSVLSVANRYTALDSRAARAELAEKGYTNTAKGWANRFLDITTTSWINGLLSSPISHAKNIAGNMFFGAYQIPERMVGSMVGKVRNSIFGGEEAIQTNEVYAQAMGMIQGIREGAEIAYTAAKKNEPTDPFTKIEMVRGRKDPFDIDFGDSDTGKAVSNAIRYYGKVVELPGRALMAEDEFFKAMSYRMELNALATRAGNAEYSRLVAAGVSPDDAAKQASSFMEQTLTNPPADIDAAAKAVARTTTFTRELESSLQGIQKTLQNPILKMFVPFVRTPTNIALEAMSRTPGLNFASPRFWADYNAGGIRKDMAIARVTLGTGIITGVGMSALEGKVTGYGPYRNEDKESLKGAGWQEFSFVFNKSDVSDEEIERFKGITTVSVGPDKVYISYAGLEPLGTLLSVGATAGEYSMSTVGEADMEKIITGGAMGVYQYLADQPMLAGFGEIQKVFSAGSKDAPSFLYNVMNRLAKQTTSFVAGAVPVTGTHSSLVAAIERYVNPDRSNVMESLSPEEIDPLAGAGKGFWEAVGTIKSRTPGLSDSLPPALDPLTGNVKTNGKGNLYEMFNPFKRADGTFEPGYATLIEYGIPQYKPDRKIDGVELSADQYNRLIELATDGGKLAERIDALGKDRAIVTLAGRDLAAAQTMISAEITSAYKFAKEQLLAEDKDLAGAIADLKETQRDVGKYKR
jgi:hypothetical protein